MLGSYGDVDDSISVNIEDDFSDDESVPDLVDDSSDKEEADNSNGYHTSTTFGSTSGTSNGYHTGTTFGSTSGTTNGYHTDTTFGSYQPTRVARHRSDMDMNVDKCFELLDEATKAVAGISEEIDLTEHGEVLKVNSVTKNEDFDTSIGVAVRVDKFSDSSIDMYVRCFSKTNEWEEWLSVKEKLALEIKQIVEKNDASFAFPSQSIYVEKK